MTRLRALFGDDAGVLGERNFQLLLVIAVTVPFGNGIISPILESLIQPLGASVATIGLMVSLFMAPGILLIPVIGMLADRYGRKPILAPALLVYGIAGVLIAFTTELWMALALRILQGIGWAGLVALIVTSIGDMYSGTEETAAQGLRHSVTGLAGGAVSLLAGFLIFLAWQYPFLLYALTIPVALLVYLWFEEPTELPTVSDDENTSSAVYRRELFELVRERRVALILMARPLPITVYLGFVTYNSVLVERLLEGTAAEAGILYALVSVVYAGAASQVGRITTVIGGPYPSLIGAHISLAVGMAVVFLAPNLAVAGVGVVIIGIGFGVALAVFRSLITGFAPETLRAGLVSLSSTGSRIAGVVTPVAMGGAIAVGTPLLGFERAVQFTGLAIALLGGIGGMVLVLVARASSPVAPGERPSPK